MTIAELIRAIQSKKRVEKIALQEKATFDYFLADHIAHSMARLYSKNAQYPDIATLYPSLFDSEEIKAQKQQKMDELSAARFKQFAETFNQRFIKEVAKK